MNAHMYKDGTGVLIILLFEVAISFSINKFIKKYFKELGYT